MKIYFVRHGESEANLLRHISNRGWVHGLTEKGRAQAAALAENLREAGVTVIYTSPLKRGVETAQILAQALDVPYEATGALREFDCGIAEDRPDAEAWRLWHWVWDEWHIHNRPESRIEGGDSLTEILERVRALVRGLIAEKGSTSESLVLVGHGGLYLSVLPRILVLPAGRSIPGGGIPNTGYILAEARPEGLVCLEWCGEILQVGSA